MILIKFLTILIIVFSANSCKTDNKPRFFTKEKFETELNQEVNIDVLEMILDDSTLTRNEMIFSYYFITNEKFKIDSLVAHIKKNEPEQKIIELNKINEIWELNCRTHPIKLNIDSINKWEENMWEIGYRFDCELDGWETTYENR